MVLMHSDRASIFRAVMSVVLFLGERLVLSWEGIVALVSARESLCGEESEVIYSWEEKEVKGY